MALSLQPALDRLNIVRGRTYRSDPERAEMIAEAVEICVLEILEFLTLPTTTPLPTSVPPMSEATVEEKLARITAILQQEVDFVAMSRPGHGPLAAAPDTLKRTLDFLTELPAELTRLRAERNRLALAIAHIICDGPAYSNGKFTEDNSTVMQRMKQTARAALGERNGGAG